MVEVLVAVMVFSVGLLGAAALMVIAARSDQAAYLRTQVSFLAQNMVERMQANPIAVWNGQYNGIYPEDGTQDCAAGCTPAQLALYDRQRWSSQLRTFLPAGAQAGILCNSGGVPYVPAGEEVLMRPSYGGNCSMTITWAERRALDAHASKQTFAWEFQP